MTCQSENYYSSLSSMTYFDFIRSFVCNTKRPSVKQSMKQQVSSNLADEPTLADVLPLPPHPPPHSKLLDKKVTAMHLHTVNENPFKTVNL